jgi:hypothetical protein
MNLPWMGLLMVLNLVDMKHLLDLPLDFGREYLSPLHTGPEKPHDLEIAVLVGSTTSVC